MSKSDSNETTPTNPVPPPSSRLEVDRGTDLPAPLIHHTRAGTAPAVTPSPAAAASTALAEIKQLIGELSSDDKSNLSRNLAGLPSIKTPPDSPDGPGMMNVKRLVERLNSEDKAALLQWIQGLA